MIEYHIVTHLLYPTIHTQESQNNNTSPSTNNMIWSLFLKLLGLLLYVVSDQMDTHLGSLVSFYFNFFWNDFLNLIFYSHVKYVRV